MPRREPTRPVTMRLPVSVADGIQHAAEQRDRTMTSLVTAVLRQWLRENEPEEGAQTEI